MVKKRKNMAYLLTQQQQKQSLTILKLFQNDDHNKNNNFDQMKKKIWINYSLGLIVTYKPFTLSILSIKYFVTMIQNKIYVSYKQTKKKETLNK